MGYERTTAPTAARDVCGFLSACRRASQSGTAWYASDISFMQHMYANNVS